MCWRPEKHLFFLNFYGSIFALRCCVSFCCRAECTSHTHTHIPSFGLPSRSHHHSALSRAPYALRLGFGYSPLDFKEIKSVHPAYSLEGLMLKLKFQYFGHLIQRANPLEKTLMLGKTEAKRRRGQQRMRWLNSIFDSMDMNLSKLWEIVKGRRA